jgi:small-conductance mechanosensitive channel
MSTLFTSTFWFNLRPGSMSGLPRNIFIGLIIALVIAAIVLLIAKKKKGIYRKLFSSLYNFCLSNMIIGVMLLFFNYEIVPFFSARFWYLIWLVVSILWLINIIKTLKKIMSRQKEQTTVDEIKKYLP